jgi:hypothetical protein
MNYGAIYVILIKMVRSIGDTIAADSLKNGSAGQIPYQIAANVTSFVGPGSAGQVLTSNGGGTPTFQSAPAAVNATNISGGTAGQLPYQSATSTTAFVANGTSGHFLRSNGTAAPSYVAITSVAQAGSITGGSAGQVVYQASTSVTGTTNTGTTGQVLTSNGTAAPAFQTPSSSFASAVVCTDTTDSTSETTGSVKTAGGLSAQKNIYGGGRLVTAGYLQTDSFFNATSASDGSLRVTNGGMGCAQDCFVGNTLRVNSTTDTANSTTGSIVTPGGVGIGKAVYAGGTIRGDRLLSASDATCYSVKMPSNSPSTALDTSGSTLRVNGVSDFSAVTITNLSTVNAFPFVYEIGTFTPTFIPINPADDANFASLIRTTYITRNGRYTRVGNSLTIYVEVEWTSNNSPQLIGIALEKGVPYTIGAASTAMYGYSYNMEPVSPLGIDDGIPISTFNATTGRFEQLNWVNGTSRSPYLFVNGTGPITGNYRIAYTMQCYVA